MYRITNQARYVTQSRCQGQGLARWRSGRSHPSFGSGGVGKRALEVCDGAPRLLASMLLSKIRPSTALSKITNLREVLLKPCVVIVKIDLQLRLHSQSCSARTPQPDKLPDDCRCCQDGLLHRQGHTARIPPGLPRGALAAAVAQGGLPPSGLKS